MVSALSALGVKLTIFVADHSLSTDKVVIEGECRVVRFHPGHWAGNFLHGRASLAFAFKEVVCDALATFEHPDVIESQDYCGLTYFLSMEKLCGNPLLQDVPIAVMMHTPEYALRSVNASTKYAFPEFWNDELERFSLKAADMVWAPSQNVLSLLDPDALSVTPQVIRNPYTLPERQEGPATEGLLYFGRVQRLKGIEPLLAAYSRLVKRGLREPLNIIGGDASYEVRGITMMDHVKKVYRGLVEQGMLRFAGLMDRREALERLKHARVVVVPSLYENFSYAALEAMAFGRVIVTSRQCGHTELMQSGHDGFVFDHNVPGDLEAKLEEAVLLSNDDCARIGANARATVASACAPKVVAKQKLEAVKRYQTNPVGPRKSGKFPFLRVERLAPIPADGQSNTARIQEKGLLSIVIPYFNLELYLQEAIESALAVDYHNVEILVVNASSTKAESIAEFYRLKQAYHDRRNVRFLHVEDKGLADTRNRGADLARGEFVTFLDSDDLVRPNYYSTAIRILNDYDNVGFVGCWVQYFEGNDGTWITWNAEPPYLLFHNTMNSASAVYRRDVFLRCGGNDLSMFVGMEDYEMLIRIVAQGFGGVAIPRFLFDYRVRQDSMMRQLAPRSNMFNYEQIAEKNPEIFIKHSIALSGLLNANGPGYRHDNPLISAGY